MDKIWERNPSKSKVIGLCVRDKKTNDHAEPTQSNPKKRKKTLRRNGTLDSHCQKSLYTTLLLYAL